MTKDTTARDAAIAVSYDAMALVDMCESTAWRMTESDSAEMADSLARVLKVAKDKMIVVHDQLERGE